LVSSFPASGTVKNIFLFFINIPGSIWYFVRAEGTDYNIEEKINK
jgi:hypothetical protein